MKKTVEEVAARERVVDADFFVLRAPLLPLESISQWAEGARALQACSEGAGGDDGELEHDLDADRVLLRRRLAELAADDQVVAALELASPDLVDALVEWRDHPGSKRSRSAERALVRYLTRLGSRPDLFGLAGAYTLGKFSEHTRLGLAPRSRLERHVAVDAGAMRDLVRAACSEAIDDPGFVVRSNPGVYRVGGRIRVAARKKGSSAHRLVEMKATPSIELALRAARTAISVGSLVDVLVADGSPADHAPDVVRRLIRNEVLLPAAELAVTGHEPMIQAKESLAALPNAEVYTTALDQAAAALSSVELGRGLVDAVAAALKSAGVERKRYIHVDARRPGELRLSRRLLAEMRRTVDVLAAVAPPPADAFAPFAEAFERRFGTRSVPVLEVLDPDLGIRLGADGDAPEERPRPHAATRSRVLLGLVDRGRAGGGRVELTPADVKALSAGRPQELPTSFGLLTGLTVADGSVEGGEFRLVEPTVIGSPGVRLLGRLCRSDPELAELVREHLRREAEQSPDTILAEVTVAPETEIGLNITQRPLLRDWEIEYGGPSGAPVGRRLEPSDLLVSVESGEVILRSASLGRRVLPVSTTAMNPMWVSLPAARFLLSLNSQRAPGALVWGWGELGDAPVLPRVTHARAILTLGRWNVPADEFAEVRAGTDAAGFRRLQNWRVARGIPRYANLDHPKSKLLVDFGNVLSVDAFLAITGGLDMIRFVESPITGASPVRGEDGSYAHELIIPFIHARDAIRTASRKQAPVPEQHRRFTPGSEWLYANLFGPAGAADRVLVDHVGPVARAVRESRIACDWFFIRYSDPAHHLRVRFHGDPSVLLTRVLPALNDALADALTDGLLYRVSLDTYEREVERYGGLDGVQLMEQIAAADSDAVVRILERRPTAAERHRLAVASVAALYADSELPLEERHACCLNLRAGWLPVGVHVGDVLGARERAERADVARALAVLETTDPTEPWVDAIRERSRLVAPLLQRLRALDDEGILERSRPDVMCSLAHMCVNRLLKRGGNLDEARVHHALARVYEGRIARERAGLTRERA
jgi:lantibiotic biosynthesis protein